MTNFLNRLKSSLLLKRFLGIFSIDVLVRGSGLVLLPVYLRLMTKEEYGLYGYLSSIIGVSSSVLGLGLYVPQIKMYHDLKNEQEKGAALFTLNVSLLIYVVLVLASAYLFGFDIVVVKLLFRHGIDYRQYRLYVLGTIFVSVFSMMLYSYFLTSERIGRIKLYNISRLVILNIVVLVALYLSSRNSVLIRLRYSMLVEAALIVTFGYVLLLRMVPTFRVNVLVKALKIGLPVMLSALANMFYNLSDRFFLEKYYSLQVIGVYTLGLTLSSVVSITMTSFQSIWMPLFLKEEDASANIDRVRRMALFVIGIYALLGAGIVAMTSFLLFVNVIDRSYGQVTLLLPLLLASSICYAVSQLFQNFMVYFEVTHIGLSFNVVANVVCVLLCMWLVPRYGMYGAGSALAFSAASSLGMHYVFVVNRATVWGA